MRIEAKLPENLWPEFFKSAVYITNRTPTKQLGWLTPIETLHRELNRPNPRPAGAHLHILGSRVYLLINKIPKKAKLSPGALIGYLVGYDSTNIFRIKVIRSRDVLIDENKQYNPDDPYVEEILHDSVPGRRVTLDIPEFRNRNEGNPFGIDESSSEDDEEEESLSIRTTVTDADNKNAASVEPDPFSHSQLLTPDLTPEPSEHPQRFIHTSRANDQHSSRDAPSQEIVGDIDPKNIISGSRRRQPASRRREAYATSVATIDNFSGFYATFSTGLLQSHSSSIHRDQLAPEPRNWRDMLKHGCRDGFLDAAQQEIKELTEKKTFKHVKRPARSTGNSSQMGF